MTGDTRLSALSLSRSPGTTSTSTSDNRAGVANTGDWNANPSCNIWINGARVAPPKWKNSGQSGTEFAFTDEIYTNRPPTLIHLSEGWNTLLIRSAPSWKWCFTFSPIDWNGITHSPKPEASQPLAGG